MFSPVRLLIQKLYLASDEAVQETSCIAPHTCYMHGVQIWRIRQSLSLLNHMQTVHMQALLSNMWCVYRAHASRWICLSIQQPSIAVFSSLNNACIWTVCKSFRRDNDCL